MRDDIRQALQIGPSATVAERTIDITTTGRRSGQQRRIEICFYRVGDAASTADDHRHHHRAHDTGASRSLLRPIYLTGVPASRRRDWLINLEANPDFLFHLKNGVQADLHATASVITDPDQRRDILRPIVDEYNARWSPDSPFPHGELDEWVAGSPLALVTFADS